MPLILIEGPAAEPVTVAEVKAAARIDGAEFDLQAQLAISALRSHAEARTGRCLIEQTLELVLDAFPAGEIDLLSPRVSEIVSVKYVDPAGVEQTLASNRYVIATDSLSGEFAWLFPANGIDWPDTAEQANTVRIRFKAGFGAEASTVPSDIRLWIIAHAVQILQAPDGQGEQQIKPLAFLDRLLDPYIVYRVV